MVPRTHEHRARQPGERRSGDLVLLGSSMVGDVTGDHDEVQLATVHVVEHGVECFGRVVGVAPFRVETAFQEVGIRQLRNSQDVRHRCSLAQGQLIFSS